MASFPNVEIRFFPPPEHLRRHLATFYLLQVTSYDGAPVADWFHSEWGNMRFCMGDLPVAECWDGAVLAGSPFLVSGPSTKAVKFTFGTTRVWGIVLQPLGWAQFIRAPAGVMANATVDGATHPAFANFFPLAQALCHDRAGSATPDPEVELAGIIAHLDAWMGEPVADHERICAIYAAIVDPDTFSVAGLVERVGASERTVERICERAFGFPPRMLLRRQRFTRSLAQFMIDPSLKWIDAIDGRYHDQAQFVRDFRAFMGMTPRQYAAMPKPILSEVVRNRALFASATVRTLERRDGEGGASDRMLRG